MAISRSRQRCDKNTSADWPHARVEHLVEVELGVVRMLMELICHRRSILCTKLFPSIELRAAVRLHAVYNAFL
jgi:hypothetical protein